MKRTGVMLVVFLMVLSTFIMPVFGDTVPDNTSSYFQDVNITDNNNNVVGHIIYSLNVLDSYISDISYDSDLMMSPKTLVPYTTSSGTILYRVSSTTFGGQSLQGYETWNNTSRAYIYCTPVNVVCTFSNFSDSFINIPQEIRTTLNIATTNNDTPVDIGYNADVGNVVSNDIHVNLYNDYVYFDFGNQYRRIDSNSFWLPPHSSNICSFTMYIYHAYTSTYTINPYVFRATSVEVRSTDINGRSLSSNISLYNDSLNLSISANGITSLNSKLDISNDRLNNINNNVQSITDAYNSNASNVTETQSNITSTDSLVSDLHDQELTYYQQNESALNNVGLSNFSFDSDQSSGLGSVVNDFTTLWNNIGPLQIIFTFTLSLSLATYLLRHRPITNAIKKNDKR